MGLGFGAALTLDQSSVKMFMFFVISVAVKSHIVDLF